MSNLQVEDVTLFALAGIAFSILFVGFIILFVFRFRQKQKDHLAEKQQLQLLFNSELSRAQLELSEQVMRNISQEIHDNIGQSLMLAKMHLDRLDTNTIDQHIGPGRELVARSLNDLRNLSRSLNGSFILDLGLVKAVEREANLITQGGTITCTIDEINDHFSLGNQKEIILFRCIQELLSNAVRHSGCSEIRISFHSSENSQILMVTDNGKGIDLNPQNRGIGLESLSQRVKILGGQLSLNATPGGGTEVEITIPRDAER